MLPGKTYDPWLHRWRHGEPSNGDDFWFSFDYGPAHIVFLSSEHETRRQWEWLEKDLEEADRPDKRGAVPWIIAVAHHPMYNAGHYSMGEDNTRHFSPLFSKYRVSLYLSGHCHNYERTKPITEGEVADAGGGGGGTTSTPSLLRPPGGGGGWRVMQLEQLPRRSGSGERVVQRFRGQVPLVRGELVRGARGGGGGRAREVGDHPHDRRDGRPQRGSVHGNGIHETSPPPPSFSFPSPSQPASASLSLSARPHRALLPRPTTQKHP